MCTFFTNRNAIHALHHSPVQSRFGRDTMKKARVVQIDPKNTHFPIVTSEDDHLPRGHKIKVVARFMRNELVAVQDPLFTSDLRLTSGTFVGVATKSEKVADYYRQTQNDLTDAYNQMDPSKAAATDATTANTVHAEETVSVPSLQQGPQLSSSDTSLGSKKRKAATMSEKSSSCHSIGVPKVAKLDKTPAQPQQSGSWRNDLESLLEKNRLAANQRRADWSTLAIQSQALKTALAVCSLCPDKSLQNVAQLAPAIGTAEQRLQYLTGNKQNLLNTRVLEELTQGWESWLQQRQQPQQQPSELCSRQD